MERNRIRWDVSRATLTVRSAVVGGQARRVVEAQEEAEEAHGFERQNRKREIDVCVFVSILLATSMSDDGGDDRCNWHAAYRRLAWRIRLL
jgi:hypothetical protein